MKNNKRDLDHLLDEIGMIDDDIIESTVNAKEIKKFFPYKKYLSIAACFALVAVSAVLVYKNKFFAFDSGKVVDYSSDLSKGTEIFDSANKGDMMLDESIADEESSLMSDDKYHGDLNGDDTTPGGNYDENNSGTEDSYFNPNKGDEDSMEDLPPSDGKTEDIIEPSEPTDGPPESTDSVENQIVPSLTGEEEIDDFNKLAYYTGWSVIKGYDSDRTRLLSTLNKDGCIKLLSTGNVGFSDDTSVVVDYYQSTDSSESTDEPTDTTNTLIPIDPGYDGEIYAYAIYKITVNSVEYFRINLSDECFLSKQVGFGEIEVMILGIEIEGVGDEIMIVFRNGDAYYSCLAEGTSVTSETRSYTFNASKYVSYFSIVKIPELEEFKFSVDLSDAGYVSKDNKFTTNDGVECVISSETFFSARQIESVEYTAMGLEEKLYKSYLEDVAAGVITPVMPEIPQVPTTSDNYGEAVFVGTFADKSEHNIPSGSITFSKSTYVKDFFLNGEIDDFVKTMPDDLKITAVWVRGAARISDYSFKTIDGKVVLSVEYVLFDRDFGANTVFFFEGETEVVANEAEYSTTVEASFGSYSEEGKDYVINLNRDETYSMYVDHVLVYRNGYKVTNGVLCLVGKDTDDYLEISSSGTFEYEGRTYKLLW